MVTILSVSFPDNKNNKWLEGTLVKRELLKKGCVSKITADKFYFLCENMHLSQVAKGRKDFHQTILTISMDKNSSIASDQVSIADLLETH